MTQLVELGRGYFISKHAHTISNVNKDYKLTISDTEAIFYVNISEYKNKKKSDVNDQIIYVV